MIKSRYNRNNAKFVYFQFSSMVYPNENYPSFVTSSVMYCGADSVIIKPSIFAYNETHSNPMFRQSIAGHESIKVRDFIRLAINVWIENADGTVTIIKNGNCDRVFEDQLEYAHACLMADKFGLW